MGPLEGQQVLLTDEPSLQPYFIDFIISGILNGNGLQLSTKVDVPETIAMYQKTWFRTGETTPVSSTVARTSIPALCGWRTVWVQSETLSQNNNAN